MEISRNRLVVWASNCLEYEFKTYSEIALPGIYLRLLYLIFPEHVRPSKIVGDSTSADRRRNLKHMQEVFNVLNLKKPIDVAALDSGNIASSLDMLRYIRSLFIAHNSALEQEEARRQADPNEDPNGIRDDSPSHVLEHDDPGDFSHADIAEQIAPVIGQQVANQGTQSDHLWDTAPPVTTAHIATGSSSLTQPLFHAPSLNEVAPSAAHLRAQLESAHREIARLQLAASTSDDIVRNTRDQLVAQQVALDVAQRELASLSAQVDALATRPATDSSPPRIQPDSTSPPPAATQAAPLHPVATQAAPLPFGPHGGAPWAPWNPPPFPRPLADPTRRTPAHGADVSHTPFATHTTSLPIWGQPHVPTAGGWLGGTAGIPFGMMGGGAFPRGW